MMRNPFDTRQSDPQACRLVRTIGAMVAAATGAAGGGDSAAEPRLIIEGLSAREWASVTFNGALHRLDLRLEGPAQAVRTALATLARDLPTRDIPLPGHFVAEIALTPGDPSHGDDAIMAMPFRVNALVLED